MSEKRQRDRVVAFRCTPEEKRILEEAAQRNEISLGELVRQGLRKRGVL